MRILLLILALLLTPTLAIAQEDEGSRLERLLESQLSDGDNFDVNLVGFRGALSSTASLEQLTVADREGIWLILENAQLVWNRSALLRGRLSVEELTAERVQVLRRPVPAPEQLDLPDAEATPFSLPELPVSIEIGRVAIEEVELDASVIGTAARLSLTGSAELADGEGNAVLDVTRLDRTNDRIDLDLSYSNSTGAVVLNLLVEEAEGGLISELLNVPGGPSLRLSVAGEGPVSEFRTEIALDTDGAPRLAGFVQTVPAPETEANAQIIEVDLSGDISPLLQQEYRSFFGDAVDLESRVTLFEDGRIALDGLNLSSAALSLEGDLALRSDYLPERFRLNGSIEDPDGGSVRLPVPNAEIFLDRLILDVAFDGQADSTYRADLDILGLSADDLTVAQTRLDIVGTITEADTLVSAITANLSATTTGLSHTDPALATAIGSTQQITADLSWSEGEPLDISELALLSGDLALEGDAVLNFEDGRFDTIIDLAASAGDLTRFAPVAGQPLAGSLVSTLSGSADLLSGAFDLTLEGTATDLRVAEAVPDGLFAGTTDLTIAAQRDETGLTLETLSLDGRELTLDGQGRVSSSDGSLRATARLADLGLVNDFVRGPATVRLSLDRAGSGSWALQSDITGPQGITISANGDVALPNNAVDLRATGRLPLGLANSILAPRSVNGTLTFDLGIEGQPSLAAVSGTFATNGARLSLPTFQTALERVNVNGRIAQERVTLDVSGGLAAGGTLNADAAINIGQPSLPITASIEGRGLRLIDPTLYSATIDTVDLSYSGTLSGSSTLSGAIVLGETELRIPETGIGAADIPDIRHINETSAQRQTRLAAGLIETGGAGGGGGGGSSRIGLNLTVTAPGRVFLRGRGLDAELGGTLRLGGTSTDVIPSGRFDLVRGRLSILGTRLDLAEGSATLQGSFDPFIRLLATSRSGGFTIGINMIGFISNPEITFTSDPALPEDEVLAQLLFGRSVSALSPVQLLQLADAAASLAGGSSNAGIFANLREGLGLDDLDLQTDDQGNAAVRAGRYLSENIYTDVTINSDGETDLSLNIDLTPEITARGSFSSDGDSSLGVFFERDY